jgi:hypothetical protein
MSSKVLGTGCSKCGSTVGIIEPTARDGGIGFIAKATRHLFFTGKGGVGKAINLEQSIDALMNMDNSKWPA